MKKRVLKTASTALLVIVLVLALGVSAFAQTFNDISGHWAETYIEKWAGEGVVNGYPDGTFKPDNDVTRAETAAIICRFLKLDTKTTIENPYSDVNESDWYYGNVLACYEAGVMIGNDDGTFLPKNNITRQEAITTLGRAVNLREGTSGIEKFTDAGDVSAYADGYVNAMIRDGYVEGYPDNTLRPRANITRAELVKILYFVTTPVTKGTYKLNLEITDTLGKKVSASTGEYLAPNSMLTVEVVALIEANYDELRAAFPSVEMKKILDEGLAAIDAGSTVWEDYVEEFYGRVDGSTYIASLKDILKNADSKLGELVAGVQYKVTFSDTKAGREDVVYTATLWIERT